jgi:hypothetical protein
MGGGNKNKSIKINNNKKGLNIKMADKQIQAECSVKTLLNIANSSKPSKCGKCDDLELRLLQSLNELSSAQLIVDLLNKEHKHKQDEQTFDIVRNGHWT